MQTPAASASEFDAVEIGIGRPGGPVLGDVAKQALDADRRPFAAIGAADAGLCRPSASNQPIWPRRATRTVTPGMVPLSISRLNASDIRCKRCGESPIDCGLPIGSGGVCRALRGGMAVKLETVWAVIGGRSRFSLFRADRDKSSAVGPESPADKACFDCTVKCICATNTP